MSLLAIIVPCAVVLAVAYFTYGRTLARLLRLNPQVKTPAVEYRDDVDYAPIEPKFLLSQHFSAIAAAGPVVGPIAAGLMFGWLPALVWIVLGSILIGGVHDFTALVASIRHKARSIAEVVRDHMSQRAYLLFLAFVWIALVYIIVAFTDVTALSFVGTYSLEDEPNAVQQSVAAAASGQAAAPSKTVVTGGGIATSSLLYLVLPIVMGLLLRYTKLSLNMATLIFCPLVLATIYVGQYIPFDVESLFGLSRQNAHKAWDVALLAYCLIAGVVPMWLLLQPRGHLGGYFLYAALAGGAVGLVIDSLFYGNNPVQYPAFIGWESAKGLPLIPLLFITIACGACSGFHALIASGTTSKQLKVETDARPIGYGAMLLEAMVALLSLSCVMILAKDSSLAGQAPNVVYANGYGRFLHAFGIPIGYGMSFALMAFTTFVYDTLDVCTRLGRYIIQELTGWHDAKGKWLGTALTAGVPLFFVMRTSVDASGKALPAWQVFWPLFGASNQLLAALTLLGVTVWLWKTRRAAWVFLVTGIPTVFMYVMSSWALVLMIQSGAQTDWLSVRFLGVAGTSPVESLSVNPVLWAAVVLIGLALLMLIEAIRVILGMRSPPSGDVVPVPASA
jgi:carbon starvation protein